MSSLDSPHPGGCQAGILTQTIASNASTKWILPARIRSARHKDVVFISPCSIQLRELLNNGQLADVTASFELGVPILAAKIVSAKAHTVSLEDAILEEGRDEVRFTIDGQPFNDSLPPQILVLSLASSELFFAYAKELNPGHVGFVYARKHVTGGLSLHEKYGKHLVVDPESRALAIAPSKGSFGIMALKDVSQIYTNINEWDPRIPHSMVPVKEQRFVKVDGTILRMDFLQSTSLEPEKVILLLIVANNGNTRLLLYRWDVRRPLTTLTPMPCSGQILEGEEAFPLLLIPSCKVTSFGIVTKSSLVFYHGVTDDHATRTPFDIPLGKAEPGKLWVQWARPVRHEKHKKNYEDVFLIREDGLLRTFVVNHNSNPPVSNYSYGPGDLGIRVDTAICMLQSPPTMGGDILVAGGDMEEGGVFQIQAKGHPIRLQNLTNWSPIRDLIHLDHKFSQQASRTHAPNFITTGTSKGGGSILELRYGLEAQISLMASNPDGSMVDRLWTLHRQTDNTIFYVISQSEHTSIIAHNYHTDELSSIDAATHQEFLFEESTLACTIMANDMVIQITKHSINVALPGSDQYFRSSVGADSRFLCADINSQLRLFVVIHRTSESTELMIGQPLSSEGKDIDLMTVRESLNGDITPVDITIFTMQSIPLCIIASEDGRLRCFTISNNLTVTKQVELDLNPVFRQSNSTSLSSVAVLVNREASNALLLCGLKTGKVCCIGLIMDDSLEEMKFSEQLEGVYQLGDTTVSLHPESLNQVGPTTDGVGAVALCGSQAVYVKLFYNNSGIDYSVNQIILTNRDDQSYFPELVTAYDRISTTSSTSETGLSGMMAFMTEEHLLLCNSVGLKICPRKAKALPNPKLMTYSNHIKRFVVSVTDRSNPVATQSNSFIPSPCRPMLEMVNLQTKIPNSNADTDAKFICGMPGDSIQVMFSWAPTDGKFHYDMIILGVNSQEDGQLFYLSTTRLKQQSNTGNVKIAAKFPQKMITTACAYGLSSLLVCADRELRMIHLDMKTKNWEEKCRFKLPSSATSIAAQGSSIYVATKSHSMIILREEADRMEMIYSDRWAGMAQNIILHGQGASMINLVSDRGSRIVYFSERPQKGARPSFEVRLPLAVDDIAQIGNIQAHTSRYHFQATTIDGTIYFLTTLSSNEIRLLKFLEELIEPYYSVKLKKLSMLTGKSFTPFTGRLEALGVAMADSESRHVRGDVLKNMLQPGPLALENLLKAKVKIKDEMDVDEKETDYDRLVKAANPVIVGDKDVIESVKIWLRKILQVSFL